MTSVPGRGLEIRAERGDLLARDADVAGEGAGGGDDVAAFDDAIEFHGQCSSYSCHPWTIPRVR